MGIERRLFAAVYSLAARARLRVCVTAVGPEVACSPFGDTDKVVSLTVGDAEVVPTEGGGRSARVEGDVVLHTTVGGRYEWTWASRPTVLVASRTGPETSRFEFEREPEPRVVVTSWGEGNDPETTRHEVVLSDEDDIEIASALAIVLSRVRDEFAARAVFALA